jgi:hypothetical protein
MARRKRPVKKGKGFGIEKMADDVRDAAINALRNAAKEVINDLAAISPDWSGEFKESWFVETADGKRGKEGGEGGKYSLFNIPQLKVQGRNAKGQFTAARPISTGKIELFIGNSSPYAQEAMDLIPGNFVYPGFEPKGQVVARGKRQDNIRGKIEQGRGNNRSTAPLDWYTTYMEGGAFTAAFNKGAKAGFLVPVNRPRFN